MKKIVKSNYRVVALPVSPLYGAWREGEQEQACQEIKQQIERHVDGVSDLYRKSTVYIEHDAEEICEFCGHPWELDSDGSPACCNAACEEWFASQPEETK